MCLLHANVIHTPKLQHRRPLLFLPSFDGRISPVCPFLSQQVGMGDIILVIILVKENLDGETGREKQTRQEQERNEEGPDPRDGFVLDDDCGSGLLRSGLGWSFNVVCHYERRMRGADTEEQKNEPK